VFLLRNKFTYKFYGTSVKGKQTFKQQQGLLLSHARNFQNPETTFHLNEFHPNLSAD